jgi:putative ABC transport system permease protein
MAKMFRTRSRKILRDIAAYKLRTLLVAINIFMGVLGVVTLTSTSDLMISTTEADIHEDELAMIFMNVTLQDYSNIDNAKTLETLRAHPGTTVVEGWVGDHLFWKSPKDKTFLDGIILASSEPFGQIQITPPRLIDGDYPVIGESQLAIDRRMADRYDLKVGDQIVIRILKDLGARPDPTAPIPEEVWTISGILFNPYLQGGGSTIYATYEDKAEITGLRGFTFINTRFQDYATASHEYENFIRRIQGETPYDSGDEELQDPGDSIFMSSIEETMTALAMLSVVTMIVAGFLVFTVINTLITQQIRQIGIMKTIGATRWDIFKIYAGIAFVYGVMGVIPGVLLGIPAAHEVSKVLASQINVWVEGFSISLIGVVAGVVMGVGVPLLTAVVPVYFGTRVSILEAITDRGISARYGSGYTAKLIGWLPFPIVVRQAFANISQKKIRLALTTLTLTLAAGAFMGVMAVFLSLDRVISDMFDTYNYEVVIVPEQKQDTESIINLIGAMDVAAAVYPSYSWDAMVPSDSGGEVIHLWVVGFDPNTDAIQLHLEDGTAWQDDPTREGIVLTRPKANELDKKVGDPITLTYNGQIVNTQVIGIDTNPEEDAYMAWQPLYRLTHSSSEEPSPSDLIVQLSDRDASTGAVDKVIGEMREELLHNGINVGFFNQVGEEEEVGTLILAMSIIFNIASVLMAIVAGIGLLTMLSISVFERQREIGVMRSVGASSVTVASQFLIEGLVIGVLGWLVGIPVSYGVSAVFQAVIPWEAFDFQYPPTIILLGLIGTLVLVAIASLWPSITASRKTVSEVLRYQ